MVDVDTIVGVSFCCSCVAKASNTWVFLCLCMQTLSRVEDLVAACDERQIGDKLRVNKSLGPLTTSVKNI